MSSLMWKYTQHKLTICTIEIVHSVSLRAVVILCKHHCYLFLGLFPHPKSKPPTHYTVIPHSYLLPDPSKHKSTFCLYGFASPGHFISQGSHHMWPLVSVLFSLTLMFLSSSMFMYSFQRLKI
jgi:hypothetical protein